MKELRLKVIAYSGVIVCVIMAMILTVLGAYFNISKNGITFFNVVRVFASVLYAITLFYNATFLRKYIKEYRHLKFKNHLEEIHK